MTGRACPPWCTNDACDGNHAGETIPAARGVSIAAGVDTGLVLTPYHDQADGLDPVIFLAEDWRSSDWAFQLPAEEARRLGQELMQAADLIDARPRDGAEPQ
ncbi:hypothetical protein QOZ88_19355 [Blastococcus sp. BMG 814]|uniref:Uncharacterized protein n=1 Tax=Blastococcus carthaginiensis TaxID=3050034 RepID=A0ABT9IGW7_9ACTN|nr:hypothetical protein [Blastococcus carthaginiensis]MDP5184796.1 hypothetical protein [Blastococcus carthaginiensis]